MELSEYLAQLDGQFRLYDVGRRIRKVNKGQFQKFETLESAYPFPYLQHAWLALYISPPKQPENETLMFLKWPLDEQGKLIPYVRDDLVHRLIKLSETPLQADTEIDDPLKDNPFAFKPDDVRLANLHAIIQGSQHRKPSSHYDTAVKYLQAGTLNPESLANWQNLGLQGIADVSARINEHKASLHSCLARMPQEAFLAFAQCLEHHPISADITQVVLDRYILALDKPENTIEVEAAMRILGGSISDETRIHAWQLWLDSDYATDVACMLAFATRNYDDLAFIPQRISDFLVNLAKLNQDKTYTAFVKIAGDLLFLPGIRNLLLNALRDENRPAILGEAMQALLRAKQQ
ncbi:DUF3549 family protein [Oceaniserpentilla sp. 4NH20-0058]|uniref:DUF3549 family protein n=1 Tax=Oceaniserpentilla sp. 4NH20-0058 TaxID=3127660 RepID=UPI0031041BE5